MQSIYKGHIHRSVDLIGYFWGVDEPRGRQGTDTRVFRLSTQDTNKKLIDTSKIDLGQFPSLTN